MHLQKLKLAVIILIAITVLVFALQPGNTPLVSIPNTKPKIVEKSIMLGPAPPDKEIQIMIVPKIKLDQLDKYLQEVFTPGSPNYGKFLSPTEVYAKFGYGIWQPNLVQYASRFGIQVNQTGPFIKLRGTIAQFQNLFQTPFAIYKYGNTVFYAPTQDVKLPAGVAQYIAGILGLHNLTLAKPFVKYTAKVVKPDMSYQPRIIKIRPNIWIWLSGPLTIYTPLQLHELYRINPLFRIGLNGTGSTIVIFSAYGDPHVGQSLKEFNLDMGLPDPPKFLVIYYQATQFPPQGDPEWALEANLDVQWAHAMAPGADKILVYTPYPDDSLYMAIADMTVLLSSLSKPIIYSLSWGAYEDALKAYGIDITPYETILATAAASGIAIFASSGDIYATAYPSTSKYVTSVGGTALYSYKPKQKLTTQDDSILFAAPIYAFETGWGDYVPNATIMGATITLGYYLGGSGGGVSKLVPKPWWQSALPYVNRTTPDIALVASPLTGVNVYMYNATYGYAEIYIGVGGTSLSAPLMAGVYAVVQQGHATRLGHAAPRLYALYAKGNAYKTAMRPTKPFIKDTLPGTIFAFRFPGGIIYGKADLTLISGNNSNTFATPWQYNTVTGLGSPDAYQLYQLLASNATTLNMWQRSTTYAQTPTIIWPGQLTISVWVYIPSNMSGKLVPIVSTMTAATTGRLSLVKGTANNFVFWLYTPSGWAGCIGPTIQFNTWYHVVVTYNNATGSTALYYNGQLVATCTLPSVKISPAPLYIGYGATPAGVAGFVGYMTNLQIYNAVISSTHVQALFLAGPYGGTLNYPLIGWWPMAQMSGTTISARSGPAATISGPSYTWTAPPTYISTPTYPGATDYQFKYVLAPILPK